MTQVLVCSNRHIDGLVITPGWNAWNRHIFHPGHLSWMDRSAAEHSSVYRQLIPYVVLRCGDSVFSYRRKGGGEGRLEGRKSVGLGGHIETQDKCPYVGHGEHWRSYANGMKRELFEEVALSERDTEFFGLHDTLPKGIVRDDSSPVGRVHLGILHILDLDEPSVTPREAGITEAGFRTMDEIEADLSAYECWSVLAFQAMKGGVK